MDAASGADVPEAAVLDRVVGSFDACPVVVRLVQDGSFQLNVLAVFRDSIFDPVLDVFRVVGVSRVVRGDWHDPCGQQVVVPIEDVVGAVSEHPDGCTDGERVTRDAHRRLLIRLLGLRELRCYWDLCASRDNRTAEAVVVLFSCWIVVPRGGVVVLDRLDVRRIDGVRGVEQAAGGGLLDESLEDIVDNVFEVSEKPVNGVSRWRFLKSTVVPDEAVLEFSCNRDAPRSSGS